MGLAVPGSEADLDAGPGALSEGGREHVQVLRVESIGHEDGRGIGCPERHRGIESGRKMHKHRWFWKWRNHDGAGHEYEYLRHSAGPDA